MLEKESFLFRWSREKKKCEKAESLNFNTKFIVFSNNEKEKTIEKWSTSAGQKNKKSVFIESKIKAKKETKKAVIK